MPADSVDSSKNPQYILKGMNVAVNPFDMADGELLMSRNFYSPIYGSKKVRFGYTQFLNNPDGQPVRNLIPYSFPNGAKGIVRISNGNTYNYIFSGNTWGANVHSWSVDRVTGNTIIGGFNGIYLCLSNGTDNFTRTIDGSTYVDITDGSTPKSSYLISWDSRVIGDLNKRSLIESAIDFDTTVAYRTAPFAINSNDPSGGGTISMNANANGTWVGASNAINQAYVYLENAVFRFTGQQNQRMPFFGNIFPNTVCNTKDNLDYFLSGQGIMRNDGSKVQLASFAVNPIIKDTLRLSGITNPVGFSFDNYSFFYIGTLNVGTVTLANAMLVHDEQFDQWDIWTLADNMTSFGYFIDPTSKRPVMISGDSLGNTFRWGEEYSSDNGQPIQYQLRTRYYYHSAPDTSKKPDMWSISTQNGNEMKINIAKDFTDVYRPIDMANFVDGFLTKVFTQSAIGLEYKTISLEVIGATTTTRPQINGFTIRAIDEELPVGRK